MKIKILPMLLICMAAVCSCSTQNIAYMEKNTGSSASITSDPRAALSEYTVGTTAGFVVALFIAFLLVEELNYQRCEEHYEDSRKYEQEERE